MERCPCCKARLGAGDLCPRCAADLHWVSRCENLAEQGLAASVRLWCADKPEQALVAVNGALYYQKTPLALLFRDFLQQRQSGA